MFTSNLDSWQKVMQPRIDMLLCDETGGVGGGGNNYIIKHMFTVATLSSSRCVSSSSADREKEREREGVAFFPSCWSAIVS